MENESYVIRTGTWSCYRNSPGFQSGPHLILIQKEPRGRTKRPCESHVSHVTNQPHLILHNTQLLFRLLHSHWIHESATYTRADNLLHILPMRIQTRVPLPASWRKGYDQTQNGEANEPLEFHHTQWPRKRIRQKNWFMKPRSGHPRQSICTVLLRRHKSNSLSTSVHVLIKYHSTRSAVDAPTPNSIL